MRAPHRYCNRRRFQTVRDDVPIRERNAWELATMLGNDGWVCCVKGTNKKEVKPDDYRPGSKQLSRLHHSQTSSTLFSHGVLADLQLDA